MSKPSPSLSLCMIVKNEENKLPSAIASIQNIADEIIIVDTGSNDKTVQTAKQYATLVVQVPWKNHFAEVRNISLEEATGKWILVMDADEIFHPEDIDQLKEIIDHEQEYDGVFLTIINRKKKFLDYHEESFPALRLFRNKSAYLFSGAIHEQIAPSIPIEKQKISRIRIIHQGHHDSLKNEERNKRNINIIKKELKQVPDNPFQRFNLGVEYMAIGEYKKATEQFEKVIESIIDKPMWASKLYKTLAYSYIKQEKWDRAKIIIDQGIQQFPDFPDLYFLEGLRLIAQNKYQEALVPLYTCLSIGETKNPQYISENGMGTYKIYFVLGRIYEALGEIKKAKIFYQNTLQWNPYHKAAGTRLIKIMLKEQNTEQVISFLNIIYDNNNPSHLLMIAYLLFEAKQYDSCHEFAKKALKTDALKDQVYYLLALCSYMEGNNRRMDNYLSQIEDKESYSITDVDLVTLSLKQIVEQLNEGYERFPEADFFLLELKKLSKIIQLYETGD